MKQDRLEDLNRRDVLLGEQREVAWLKFLDGSIETCASLEVDGCTGRDWENGSTERRTGEREADGVAAA